MKNKIDAEIEKEYYKQANGLQISMLDIPKLFAECRKSAEEGKPIAEAVKLAVQKFCKVPAY